MGGGLMQLVAYGAQDVYLTGSPQITFFKVVYRRHTNFAMESIEQTFTGNTDFGSRATVTVSRNGDCISGSYLQLTLPAVSQSMHSLVDTTLAAGDYVLGWTNYVGHALIDSVSLEIGGQEIDKQFGIYMHIWSELTMTAEKRAGYDKMVGGEQSELALLHNARVPTNYYVPLTFWFNRNVGLALPLIALQYHEVKMVFNFTTFPKLLQLRHATSGTLMLPSAFNLDFSAGGKHSLSAQLYIDYIYLDTDERRKMAQMSHEYLIEQLQWNETTLNAAHGTHSVRLNFNHPCKEILWALRRSDCIEANDHFNFVNAEPGQKLIGPHILSAANLRMNGHYRVNQARGAGYFNLIQPFEHHTCIPPSGIYVYSFALRPEEHQPSGTCNFSRIDNTQLELTINTGTVSSTLTDPAAATTFVAADNHTLIVYAKNYNVLRIMSGMGGLAYSN